MNKFIIIFSIFFLFFTIAKAEQIKQIEINSMSDEERREALREAKILEVLKHDNIIEFKEVYKTKKGKLCIVMGYADDGDLAIKI